MPEDNSCSVGLGHQYLLWKEDIAAVSAGFAGKVQGGVLGVAFHPTSLGQKNAELLIRDHQETLLRRVPLTGSLERLIQGDLNDDGEVGMADAILVFQVLAGLDPDGINTVVDVDGDGRVGLGEALFILQTAAGIRQ